MLARLTHWGPVLLGVLVGAAMILGVTWVINNAADNSAQSATASDANTQILQQVRTLVEQNNTLTVAVLDTSQNVKAILRQFRDCIQPKGVCAQKGAKRTAQVITELEHVVVVANVCPGLPTIPPTPPAARLRAVDRCISHLLNVEANKHGN